MIRNVLCVACGGALGAVVRYLVSLGCEQWLGRFPWGTLIVNVVGCFVLGWLAEMAWTSTTFSEPFKLTVATGFLGAMTTFSTFGVQTIQLWKTSAFWALSNVAANVIVGLVAALAGVYLASRASLQ